MQVDKPDSCHCDDRGSNGLLDRPEPAIVRLALLPAV
jgi:hypothetical protein